MPRRSFKVPFAASGDTTQIPTSAQPDGSVSFTQGFTFDYERPTDGTDPQGKVFPRGPFNSLMNEITASIGEIQQSGFPAWAEDMAPYPANAWVRHNDEVWQNTISNNSSMPGSANSGWSSPGVRGRVRITANSTFVVPQGVTTIYVSACAGGGGGGGGAGKTTVSRTAGGGGGGGAGRFVLSEAIGVTSGQSISVVIGAAGTAGAGGAYRNSGGNGGNGGNTTVGTLTLQGGSGGGGGSATTGSGGSGGSPGGQWGTDGTADDKAGDGGSGGGGPFGTAGGGGRAGNTTGISGTVGFGFGAGGAGGGGNYSASQAAGAAGTAGMPGLVLIEW